MKKLFSVVLMAATVLAPALASASIGTTVMKTFHGHGVATDQAIAHAIASSNAWEQAAAEGFGNCVETSRFIVQTAEGWQVTSVQQCARV